MIPSLESNCEYLKYITLLFIIIIISIYLYSSFKDGVEITEDDSRREINKERASAGFYELIIAEILNSDAGTYSCTATNKYGSESCECKMTVCGEFLEIIVFCLIRLTSIFRGQGHLW